MDELEMSVIGGLLLSSDDNHIEKAFSQITEKCFLT